MKKRQTNAALRELSPARIFARPTADELWLGPTQESALSRLSGSIPVRALVGPASSGRTTLLGRLASETPATILRLRGPYHEVGPVLRAMTHSVGLDPAELEAAEMQRLLEVFFAERLGRGQRVVIEIDDADGISAQAWEVIHSLLQSQPNSVHSPELVLSLEHIDADSSPAADYLRQQPSPALVVLSWMEPQEVHAYLRWRLDRFELGDILTPSAMRLIAKCTLGKFVAVDHLCQMALLLLRKGSARKVDVTLVREAMWALRGQRQTLAATEAEASPAELIVSLNGEVLNRLSLGARTLIGRSPLNDLYLENSFLSRHHAAILRSDSCYELNDLNSLNGIKLNGETIRSAPLRDGDVLGLGPYRLKFGVREEIPSSQANADALVLTDTAVMPAPESAEPANLKVIK